MTARYDISDGSSMTEQSKRQSKVPPEFLTWEYWEDNLRPHAGQAAALATVQGLRRVFGDGWIAPAATDFHPLVERMFFPTLFNRTWLAEIIAAIDAVKAVPGAHQLIERLGRKPDFLGAASELDIVSRLVEAKYDIILHPPVRGVHPDICVQTDRPLYIEVAAVHTGPDPALQTLDGIIPAVMAVGGRVHISGEIHRQIPPEHQPHIRILIEQTALEAVRANEVRQLREKEFKFDIFPTHIFDQLDEAFRKAHQGITGPLSHWSPSTRVTRRLYGEFRQIPPGVQGLVVLHDRIGVEEECLDFIAQDITGTLCTSPQPGAAVFVTRHSLRDVPAVGIYATPYGWIVRRPVIMSTPLDYDPWLRFGRETALVIRNERAETPLDYETLLNGLHTTRLAF